MVEGCKRKLRLRVSKYGWRGTEAGEQIGFRCGEGARMWEGKGCREGVKTKEMNASSEAILSAQLLSSVLQLFLTNLLSLEYSDRFASEVGSLRLTVPR